MRLRAQHRAAVGVVALAVEYAIIGVSFEAGELERRTGWISRLGSAGDLFTIAAVLLTAGCLVNHRQLRHALGEAAGAQGRPSAFWAVVHFLLFGSSLWAAFLLFERPRPPWFETLLVLAAVASGVAALGALLRAL